MNKPSMMLKWADEKNAQPISRELAEETIRKNRKSPPQLRVQVFRKYGETYITSDFLGVGCVIFRSDSAKATGETL